MKKTLLIAAAALAAGMLSVQAQGSNVYSQNIVGYVNQQLVGGFNLVVPPVSASSSNMISAEAAFPCLISGDVLYIWKTDGSGFDIAYFNGIGDWYEGVSFAAIPVPNVRVGGGVFYQNNSGHTETNTYSGTVILTNTVNLIGGFTMTGSTAPVGGSIESTNLALPFTSGDVVFLWKADGSGYDIAYYNGPGDWYDGVSFAAIPVPNVSIGLGFYYQNNSGFNTNWIQILIIK